MDSKWECKRSEQHEGTWRTKWVTYWLQVRILTFDDGHKKPMVYTKHVLQDRWVQQVSAATAHVYGSLQTKRPKQAPELVITPPSWDERSLYLGMVRRSAAGWVLQEASNTKRPVSVKTLAPRGQRGNRQKTSN